MSTAGLRSCTLRVCCAPKSAEDKQEFDMSAIKMPSNISIGSLGASGALGFCTGAAIKASVTVLAALIGMNFLVIQLLR